MIRLSVLVLVVGFALSAASSVVASDGDRPRRIGPIYVVATGGGSTVRVWRTVEGYCILAYRLELADRAVCIPSAALWRGGPMFTCLCRQRHGTTLVIGTVKPSVRRGERTDRRGVAPVQLYSAPPELDTSLRFFRTVVRSGSAAEVARRVL